MVRPFRGERYGTVQPLGLSILVLGESSYNGNRGEPLSADWNERIIGGVFKGDRDSTITRAANVFWGTWRSFPERRAFWEASAFANFVQEDMGDVGYRPDEPHWKNGEQPFQECLIDLRPQFVLALGKELWSNLPTQHRKEHPPIQIGTENRPCYLYPNDDGYAFVFGIDHPASRRGWSYPKWTPWVKAALDVARDFHRQR